jgi:hypothetical protein
MAMRHQSFDQPISHATKPKRSLKMSPANGTNRAYKLPQIWCRSHQLLFVEIAKGTAEHTEATQTFSDILKVHYIRL